MFVVALILVIVVILIFSLNWLWESHQRRMLTMSLENFILLLMTYLIILIGFGLMYTLLQLNHYSVLVEQGTVIKGPFLQLLDTGLYFSAVTLLSVGYGDITPIGIGRWIAIIEALIGYILPAAFVVRTVIDIESK